MLAFKEFLSEQAEQNVHMEHVEDLLFNEGVAGTRKAINFFLDLRTMLSGNSQSKVSATVKWDGAPAVFAGIDPRDGKFFVAKKGVFNKEPKVYKTPADVDADTDGDLAVKLKTALQEFKKLGIKSGVFQGDLMFTDDTVNTETIDGQKYTTFHPNTIIYAVPYDSDLAAKIRSAKIGVVWHTIYTGDSFPEMKASFGKSIVSQLKQTPSVWMDDATYRDVSGTATFTASESKQLTDILSQAGQVFRGLPATALNGIHQRPELMLMIKTFNNSKIRANQSITDPVSHGMEAKKTIASKLQQDIDSRKTEKGKAGARAIAERVLSYFDHVTDKQFTDVFKLMVLLTQAKSMVVKKMNQASGIGTFLKTKSGFKVTNVEGYVAIDHISGNAVKLVDRLEFSSANFSPDVIKGWQR